MNILRTGATVPRVLRPCRPQSLLRTRFPIQPAASRAFHAGPSLWGIKSQILKDVGEGEAFLEWLLLCAISVGRIGC
jgi:2-oxoisovalerate dehydrogenase E2 component (dihydrolipoyl transacylase)